jgi:hypothetical protein
MSKFLTIPLFNGDYEECGCSHTVLSYTLDELNQKTSPISKRFVGGCRASLYRVDTRNSRWLFKVRCTKPKSEGPYVVRVGIADKDDLETPVRDRDMNVYCSCPFFWYYGAAYNAYVEGYLEGRDKRGIPSSPKIPGKQNIKICKHIATVIPKVRSYLLTSFKNRKGI